MLWTQPAVIWTAILHRRVVLLRHLWWLEKHFAATAIVVHIICHQHALKAMLRTPLQHEDLVVFKDNLCVHTPIAFATKRNRSVIKKVRSRRCAHLFLQIHINAASKKSVPIPNIKIRSVLQPLIAPPSECVSLLNPHRPIPTSKPRLQKASRA